MHYAVSPGPRNFTFTADTEVDSDNPSTERNEFSGFFPSFLAECGFVSQGEIALHNRPTKTLKH